MVDQLSPTLTAIASKIICPQKDVPPINKS